MIKNILFWIQFKCPELWCREMFKDLLKIWRLVLFWKARTLPVPPYKPAQLVVLEDAWIMINMHLTFGIVHLDLELGSFHLCLERNNERQTGFQKIVWARRIFIMCKFPGMNRRRPHRWFLFRSIGFELLYSSSGKSSPEENVCMIVLVKSLWLLFSSGPW